MKLLHELYGPVIRIGPYECAIADGAAIAPIYSDKGGFLKADNYANFNLEGHQTIFSARDPAHRAVRSKAVAGLFSTSSIRAKHDIFEHCAKRFVERVRQEAAGKKSINILIPCRRAALDLVSSFLFDTPYNSMDEEGDDLSAAVFVDTAVAFGRFFFLPHGLFTIIELTRATYLPSRAEQVSNSTVDKYGSTLSGNAAGKPGTYQARLHEAGVSDHEVEIQCKDVMFAGTDSSGTVLASTCWYLAKDQAVYRKLRQEILDADAAETHNLQSLKYLDAVTREGLRLARANPTRFPRVVPSQGWTFPSSSGRQYYFPAGTSVAVAPGIMHFNAEVFEDPKTFSPERWLDPSPEMQRDLIPFNVGPRQCIARNMAQYELLVMISEIARSNLLEGAQGVGDEITVIEWFNSRVVGGKIELQW